MIETSNKVKEFTILASDLTGNELKDTKELCFEQAINKAKIALNDPRVFQAKPFCQIIPGTESMKDT